MVVEPASGIFEYRFILSPGASVSKLILRWTGATGVRSVEQGHAFEVATGIGTLRAHDIRAYVPGDARHELPIRVVVDGDDVAFEVDGWDGRTELVIDPTIDWTAALGGAGFDEGYGVAFDTEGNALVTGANGGADFPTKGAFDATIGGGGDAFVAKLSPTGALLWSTFLGGTGQDWGYGIATDPSGDAFVVGLTFSLDFPGGGFDATLSGPSDGFLTKVSNTGNLLWSSLVGGTKDDEAWGVAVDASGNVLVAGTTTSNDLPTAGAATGAHGAQDAFVLKATGTGNLLWSYYLGGTKADGAYALALDASGNAIVTGYSSSADFPTVGGFAKTLLGPTDAFVTKVSPTGSVVWSSLLGGTASESGLGVATDAAGNIFLTGRTQSTDFPNTGGFDKTLGGISDGYLAKVSSAGALLWSTFVGGTAFEQTWGVGTDSAGNVYVTGQTQSTDYPAIGGFDTTLGGSDDAILLEVDAGGSLVWSSYLGGSNKDYGQGLAVAKTGDVLVTGGTFSADFPAVGASFDATFSPGDGFLVRVKASGATGLPQGSACNFDAACATGHCADEVCCDNACSGACEACSTAKKGSGADGTCGPAAKGKICSTVCRSATVALKSTCDGAGSCVAGAPLDCAPFACTATTGTCTTRCAGDAECAAGLGCVGGACTVRGTCSEDGRSVVVDGRTPSCAPYRCDPAIGACRTRCASDGECADGLVCASNTCTKAAPAAPSSSEGGCGIGRASEVASREIALLATLLVCLIRPARRSRASAPREIPSGPR